MTRKIAIVPYNPAWPQMFQTEAEKIKQALGQHCLEVHHIGSTSVPNLSAKSDLDILCIIDALSASLDLQRMGYLFKGEFNIPLRYFFSKNTSSSKVNLHVVEPGHGFIGLNLCFRDYLRAHEETRIAYQGLKYRIIDDPTSFERGNHGFPKYTLEKDKFIKLVLNQSGFAGLMVNFCLHEREWEAARTFRQKTFFDKIPISDPYKWTFDHKDHIHLVLYQGTNIIGYAHIQLWPDLRAALRIIVVDEGIRGQGLGGRFLIFCERWLKQQGFKVLQTQSSPAAYPFYLKYNFREMPFNDPDGYESDPRDIDMGKIL